MKYVRLGVYVLGDVFLVAAISPEDGYPWPPYFRHAVTREMYKLESVINDYKVCVLMNGSNGEKLFLEVGK